MFYSYYADSTQWMSSLHEALAAADGTAQPWNEAEARVPGPARLDYFAFRRSEMIGGVGGISLTYRKRKVCVCV